MKVVGDEVMAALVELAECDEYFRLPAGELSDPRLSAYLARPDAPRPRLAAVGRQLGSTEPRVAASSMQYELAERLWASTLGLWSHRGIVVDLHDLRLRREVLTSFGLCIAAPTGRRVAADPTAALTGQVLNQLHSLHAALRALTPMADGLLWGNAATALVLAAQRVTWPGTRDRAVAAASALLDRTPLRGWVTGPVDGLSTGSAAACITGPAIRGRVPTAPSPAPSSPSSMPDPPATRNDHLPPHLGRERSLGQKEHQTPRMGPHDRPGMVCAG